MSCVRNTAGASVTLQEPKNGDNSYKAEQYDPNERLEYNEEQGEQDSSTIHTEWAFGPVRNDITFNPDTFDIKILPTYTGILAGTLEGNMKDGLEIRIDYFTTKGEQIWYLKNGNEIWTHMDVKIKFDGSFEGDYKIFTV